MEQCCTSSVSLYSTVALTQQYHTHKRMSKKTTHTTAAPLCCTPAAVALTRIGPVHDRKVQSRYWESCSFCSMSLYLQEQQQQRVSVQAVNILTDTCVDNSSRACTSCCHHLGNYRLNKAALLEFCSVVYSWNSPHWVVAHGVHCVACLLESLQ